MSSVMVLGADGLTASTRADQSALSATLDATTHAASCAARLAMTYERASVIGMAENGAPDAYVAKIYAAVASLRAAMTPLRRKTTWRDSDGDALWFIVRGNEALPTWFGRPTDASWPNAYTLTHWTPVASLPSPTVSEDEACQWCGASVNEQCAPWCAELQQAAVPYVCPGCHAVGAERCSPGCIDDEMDREREASECQAEDEIPW